MGLQSLLIGAADAVLTASDRVDEVAILAPDGVALGLSIRAASANIDHDVAIGEFNRDPIAEKVQANPVRPT
jgi:hypothetical protein